MRIKIVSGFAILALMLTIAGIWTIFELKSAGFSVQALIDENYRSINAAQEMIEAVEREDSAILLLLLGKWEQGRNMLAEADSAFRGSLAFAYSNITIEGEEVILDSIQIRYSRYKELWKKPVVDTPKEGNIEWYFSDIHKTFSALKTSIHQLNKLNNSVMYNTASDLKQRSDRAIMPGLISIIAALLFTIIFNYFVNYYMVNPVIRITDRIRHFIYNKTPYDIKIESKDEISDLSESIEHLCEFVRSKESTA